MTVRGYTLLDASLPASVVADRDRHVRFLAFVREHLREIVPETPAICEVDFFASGHAHNLGDLPLLGIYVPGEVDNGLEPDRIIERISEWAASLSEGEVHAIIVESRGPTWAELRAMRTFPDRSSS